jgi:hypothetical protein
MLYANSTLESNFLSNSIYVQLGLNPESIEATESSEFDAQAGSF